MRIGGAVRQLVRLEGRLPPPLRAWLAPAVLTALIIALGRLMLRRRPFSYEEVSAIDGALAGWPASVAEGVRGSAGVLYAAILRPWASLGQDEVVLRALSVFLVAACVPVCYALAKRLFGTVPAVTATVLLVVNSITIGIAQEALAAALVLLLGSLASLTFLVALERGTRLTRAAYVVVVALALLADPAVGVLVVAHLVGLVAMRRLSRSWIVVVGLVAGLWLALIALRLSGTTTSPASAIPSDVWGAILGRSGRSAAILHVAAIGVLVGLAAVGTRTVIRERRGEDAGTASAMIALPLLWVPLACGLVLGAWAPAAGWSSLVVALPALAILAGYGITSLRPLPMQVMVAGLAAVVGVTALVGWYVAPFEDWRGAAAYVDQFRRASDVVVALPSTTDLSFRRYVTGGPGSPGLPTTREAVSAFAASLVASDHRLWVAVATDVPEVDLASLRMLEHDLRPRFQRVSTRRYGLTNVILWEPRGWTARHACWRGDYEPGHDWSRLQAVPGAFAIVMSPVRDGSHSGRFSLHPGDLVSGGERAEMVRNQHRSAGDETWLRWSLYLPSDTFWIQPGGQVIVTQWHDNEPSGGTPPVLVTIQNRDGVNRIGLAVRGGVQKDAIGQSWIFGEASPDRWIDLQMHVRWSTGADGLMEFWVDGERVLSASMPTIFVGKWVYLKQGIYRHPAAVASTLYQDATVVAETEAELACR